jgi:hypothetical protein
MDESSPLPRVDAGQRAGEEGEPARSAQGSRRDPGRQPERRHASGGRPPVPNLKKHIDSEGRGRICCHPRSQSTHCRRCCGESSPISNAREKWVCDPSGRPKLLTGNRSAAPGTQPRIGRPRQQGEDPPRTLGTIVLERTSAHYRPSDRRPPFPLRAPAAPVHLIRADHAPHSHHHPQTCHGPGLPPAQKPGARPIVRSHFRQGPYLLP